jgi:hypothetical protein
MSTIVDFLGFNPSETEAIENFDSKQPAIPEGEYKAVASQAERKRNKAGDGWYWEFVFTVVEGEYKGRTITHYFNMMTRNEIATRIGQGQMKRLLIAINNLTPANEAAMLNVPVRLCVKCVKNTFTKDGREVEVINNTISRIDPCDNNPPAQQAPMPGNFDTAPWERQER